MAANLNEMEAFDSISNSPIKRFTFLFKGGGKAAIFLGKPLRILGSSKSPVHPARRTDLTKYGQACKKMLITTDTGWSGPLLRLPLLLARLPLHERDAGPGAGAGAGADSRNEGEGQSELSALNVVLKEMQKERGYRTEYRKEKNRRG